MIEPEKCCDCGFEFLGSSRKFYCCDPTRKYCIICKRNSCPTCHRPIPKELRPAQCRECYTIERHGEPMLKETHCGAHYCGRCVVAKVLRRNGVSDSANVIFPCGHALGTESVETYLQGICSLCGKKCEQSLDYELLNGRKCCFLCVKYEGERIEHLLFCCMGCGDRIRTLSQAGAFDNDFLLCSKCTANSQMEQRHFSELRQQEQVKERAPQSASVEGSASSKISGDALGNNRQSECSECPPDAPKQAKKTILKQFPAAERGDGTKMRKHMSMETYIESMEIAVAIDPHPCVQCQECGYQIEEKENVPRNQRPCCRLCYTLMAKSGALGFTGTYSQGANDRLSKSIQKKNPTLVPVPVQRTQPKLGKQSVLFENHPAHSQPSDSRGSRDPPCAICKASGPVIRTLQNGSVCFSCYSKNK